MNSPSPPFRPFLGARIAVVGLGRAGLPAAQRLAAWGAEVEAWDDREAAREDAAAAGLLLRDPAEGRFRADALLLSPGIPHRLPRAHPAAEAARRAHAPILCDVEFLYRAVLAAHSRARFVGVTGTNGKSTTTALIHHMLAGAGRRAQVWGNLGPAALSLNILGDDGIYTLEMFVYMLERNRHADAVNVAVMLNLSADHLDRHGDMAGYAAAKAEIFARQTREDVAVLGQDDAATAAMGRGLAARLVPVSGLAPQPGGIWAEGRSLRDAAGEILDLGGGPLPCPAATMRQNAAARPPPASRSACRAARSPPGLRGYPGLPLIG